MKSLPKSDGYITNSLVLHEGLMCVISLSMGSKCFEKVELICVAKLLQADDLL